MTFVYENDELNRISDNSLYSIFNTSSFLEFLDYERISMSSNIFNSNYEIKYFDEYGQVGSEQYSFRKAIKAMDLKILEPHIGDFLKDKYSVRRIDLKRGFHDQLRCVYYLSKEGKLIYKIRIWSHGALSIIHFIY